LESKWDEKVEVFRAESDDGDNEADVNLGD
jgi:hypothetical protein